MPEVRFRGEQRGLNQLGGGVTINTGGGGSGGGESKSSEGFNFPLKDWLIIMVVVVVGLMFLTRSSNLGGGGGEPTFTALGSIVGSMVQLMTFMWHALPLIAVFYLCKVTRFTYWFPLGWLDENLGLEGMLAKIPFGEMNLFPVSDDPLKYARVAGTVNDWNQKATEAFDAALKDKAINGSVEAQQALKFVRQMGNFSPDIAKAQTAEELGKAIESEEALKGELPELEKWLQSDAGAKMFTENKAFKGALLTSKLVSTGKTAANQLIARMDLLSVVTEAKKEQITDVSSFLNFLFDKPQLAQAMKDVQNFQVVEPQLKKSWGRSVLSDVTKSAESDPSSEAVKELNKVLVNLTPKDCASVFQAMGSLKNSDFFTPKKWVAALGETDLKESISGLTKIIENEDAPIVKTASQAGDDIVKGIAELLRDIKK